MIEHFIYSFYVFINIIKRKIKVFLFFVTFGTQEYLFLKFKLNLILNKHLFFDFFLYKNIIKLIFMINNISGNLTFD